MPQPSDQAHNLALLALARELWVMKDRQRVLEDLLVAQGVLKRDVVDSHQPSPEDIATRERELAQFVDALLSGILAQGEDVIRSK